MKNRTPWLLSIDQFKEMDRLAIEQYFLPIEIMMENAGLQLARLIASIVPGNRKILIGVGMGNNGGGMFHFDLASIAQSINNAWIITCLIHIFKENLNK
jgi:NAD(P)H-hydrate repair Nnr-like enzyme with NAD(P)H-hydrate epimerase domain